MTSALPEFLIVGIASVGKERLTVVGRNCDAPIHLNEVFDNLIRHKPRRYPDQPGDEPVGEVETAVCLRVVGIRAYERDLTTLGEGMTGSLVLEGEGLRSLAPGWVLGTRSGATLPDESISGSSRA